MNIDIFTLIIQVINFLVLVFILNKLIYKPLINLMKSRKDYIKTSIDNTENKLKEADNIKEKYEEELKKLENYKDEQIKKIDEEINEYRFNEISKTKQELEIKKNDFEKQLESEKNSILESIVRNFCFSVNDLLKDIFLSLSSKQLNSIILDKFMDEITNLSKDVLERINKSETKIIDFYSVFELNQKDREEIINVFNKCGILFDNVNFIVDENMVLGNKIVIEKLVISSNVQNIIEQFTLSLKKNM